MKRLAFAAAALLLTLVPAYGRAEDVGRRDDVRVVREDTGLLLAHRLRTAGIEPKTLVVDSVDARSGNAVVAWHAGETRGTDRFARILKRWWYRPSSDDTSTDGFDLKLALAKNDAGEGLHLRNLRARRPTEAESWLAYPGGNSYCFFGMEVLANADVHVEAGTALDIWFPYVLSTRPRYTLTIAHTTPIIGPVAGTLRDNVLHFVLPAFSVVPGADLMGEIEGWPTE